MGRFVVDTNGSYYDFYADLSDFVTIYLNILSTEIQQYEHEVLLAIL